MGEPLFGMAVFVGVGAILLGPKRQTHEFPTWALQIGWGLLRLSTNGETHSDLQCLLKKNDYSWRWFLGSLPPL